MSTLSLHTRPATLPSVLTSDEFAYLCRFTPAGVRRMIRRREVKAFGRPARIPCRELEKFGVSLADAAELLRDRAAAVPRAA